MPASDDGFIQVQLQSTHTSSHSTHRMRGISEEVRVQKFQDANFKCNLYIFDIFGAIHSFYYQEVL